MRSNECNSSCVVVYVDGFWLIFTVQGKKTSYAAASTVTFHINAMDRSTAETVKETLRKKAEHLVEMVEIKKDAIKRVDSRLTNKIKSLGSSDVTVEIGMSFH